KTAVPLPTSVTATSAPAAKADSAPLTFNPVTTYFDGVLQGNLNVTSASGCGLLGSDCKLVYSFVDSSDGGKARFGNVPTALNPLLPENAKGGAGSFTFLPYATWIDPANPTSFPTATGTQSFTVRVSENTKFNQNLASIPLIGAFAVPIIGLLQQLPLIGTLLAPLIGATATQTVNVNVGALVSSGIQKQVAYTYTVDSFDGTPISMNFFPASQGSLNVPGLDNKQATIFNGPGLGSPGETNPYGIFQAGGSVPGLGIMRGQGFPAPFDALPLGFNVITWDPRGEFDSGGILQLDNPFFEGRDVSALIDWALLNTPLLREDVISPQCEPGGDGPECDPLAEDSPSIAMMGGSYGGGIQMTTIDPRIKAIVPAIAWNSLNQSLYPDKVFKTGWANALAEALLLPEPQLSGTDQAASSIGRINSQVTQALITGNLFGFISDTAQAVLASSGPTSLLTTLNVPTFYNQGTHDALFQIQQAVENAQTQVEQNPFFSADNPLAWSVSGMVAQAWFCGGHGVCTNQTLAQQTKQNTVMFLQNMIWVNAYAKQYLKDYPIDPPIKIEGSPVVFDNTWKVLTTVMGLIPNWQFWDQNGVALTSTNSFEPWNQEFYNLDPIVGANVDGGRINSFTSVSGPLTAQDPAGAVCESIKQACEFPLNQVFATKATNAVEVVIPVPKNEVTDKCGTKKLGSGPCVTVVGEPKVSFTYSGRGNAKAVYAQIVDNATGQVVGNISTPIPVTLDGKERTVDAFPLANIVYSPPDAVGASLTLQLVANTSLYKNNNVIWSVDISDVTVELPAAGYNPDTPVLGGNTVGYNPLDSLVP
ncbi:MAG: hypothetical protein FGM52_11675, partial [Mycobacterium sp.]|nr:hypothetical protein [Mycobacterium sp.]